MISLINSRVKYIIRHPCLLFWTYLFLPIIILIAAIIRFFNKEKIDPITYFDSTPVKNIADNISEDIIFTNPLLNNKSLGYLNYYWNGTLIFLNKEVKDIDCNKVLTFFKDNANTKEIKCSNNEKDISNETINIIKIGKKDNHYRIDLTSRQPNTSIVKFEEGYNTFFSKGDLDEEIITDVFFVYSNLSTYTDALDGKNEDPKEAFQRKMSKYKIFFDLQSLLSGLLINVLKKTTNYNEFTMKLGYNSYPEHYEFSRINGVYTCSFYCIFIVLQFSLIAYNFNMRIIDEKENKLNILLERQGISKFKYNFSWLITFLALFSFSIIAFTILIISVIQFHYLLFLISMILFSLSIYSVCIFFATCIKSTKTGTTAVKFYNFGSILLGFVIILPKTPKITKILFCFIPQINLFTNLYTIFCLNNFKNLTWQIVNLKAARMSFLETIIMYLAEIVFYLGLSIIIQSVRDSGLSFFQYLKSFFVKVQRETKKNVLIDEKDKDEKSEINFQIYHQELSQFNQQKKEQDQCLRLINVSKNFDDLKAVDDFNGELFSNEIFCLLGHNGAGKTTLINMISGIFDPDFGDILLNGRSLVTNKHYLYENIGLCQQEDIFFDYLTVQEHLEYMCRIKGSKINQKEIEELINKIDLNTKKNALCSTLSGGQKRKLCIALALIGDSQIILLDEPTSGMDVMARRSLWEFLKNYKKNKIILLTTHFLDEAEYLGDRIGIMTDGHYLCSGTSSFLKSKYPCGFNINLLINSSKFNEDYKQQFYNGILQYEQNAEIKVASKGIFSINIQSNNQYIPQIFQYIEQQKEKIGIEDYTVSSTSLEDVFLKINNKANLNDLKYSTKDVNNNEPFKYGIPKAANCCQQLCSQIVRGLFPFYRNKTLFFFELLSGLGFVYIFIFFFSSFIINMGETTLNLPEILKVNDIFIYEKNANDFLENSDAYNSYGKYSFNKIEKEPNNIKQFMDYSSEKAKANIVKGGLSIKREGNYYEVYNTEADTSLNGYLYANTMLFFSAYLKKEYDLEVTIFPQISFSSFGGGIEVLNLYQKVKDSLALIIASLIALIGFIMFLGGLMFEKIKEKRTNIKHLLYLSGSNIWSYWFGFFIVDYLKLFIFSILLTLPIFFISGSATYLGLDMLGVSISSLAFIYFISFFCSKDDDGAKILFLVVFGFFIIMGVLVFFYGDKILDKVSSFTKTYTPNIMDFTPVTSMGLSFFRIIFSYVLYEINAYNPDEMGEGGGEALLGKPIDYLFTSYMAQLINFIIYSLLLILAESGLLGKLIHNIKLSLFGRKNNYVFSQTQISEDFLQFNNVTSPLLGQPYQQNVQIQMNTNNNIINTNQSKPVNPPPVSLINKQPSTIFNPLQNPYVQKEISKVNGTKELTTKIVNLTKTYISCCGRRKVRAINSLYLGLEPNEKFGLLGFNGSGKTTTFKAITNEILYDTGSITLFGYDTKRQFEHIRTMVGYCPQINPLFDYMKVKELIKFYSELKTCNESVESVCNKFGLSKYLNTYTVNLSGGNKRKLTFAIALMNYPRLLLLDEPSTGVDPESRRIMWRNINELSNSGHKYNMILTTHSMEEAEILCDTVSWFKAGNFITVGNPEELKIQYSAGYKLHIKFDDFFINSNRDKDQISGSDAIGQTFNTSASLIEGIDRYSNYILANPNLEPYLRQLNIVVQKIKEKTQKITVSLIGKDLSFELILQIIKERQSELFSDVLNMKNNDKAISEMSIAMQSLENILTSLN